MAGPTLLASPRSTRLGGADLALAVLVISIVTLMVVPLPTWLLDVLLAANLTVSVAIVLVTLYVSNALELATFPTLLLITTLVRIALNVSSTRLILLQADAGAVIRSFGEFVVRGNFVVGAVVFLILTIIQFVVVAKGSERVAEVGARFTLDALPGKQLAIDAEIRAGTIDADEARRRRRTLERESRFYGAMDGAVKFVKGDVVASLLIAIVNLVGGVAVGVGQRGLDFATALRRYGLLTIGDGLVTQIPALLLATAAGLLVTRVASDEPGTALAEELGSELFASPRALGIAGVLALGLAVVPGLPAAPFAVIGASLVAVWRFGKGRRRADGGAAGADDDPSFVSIVVPWELEYSLDLGAMLGGASQRHGLAERLRRRVFEERGVELPPCPMTAEASLPDRHVVVSIHEVPARVIAVPSDVPASEVATWIEDRAAELLLDRAADFLGIAETKALLDRLERRSPATVKQVVPKTVDVATVADVLRRLVDENVGVRDLGGVLEALARVPTGERDGALLAEHVRSEFRRALTYDLTRGTSELAVVLLDHHVEEAVRGAISRAATGATLTLSPAASRDIVVAVERAVDHARADNADWSPVILTRPDIRRFVRKLLETDLPRVRVVAFTELLPEITIKTVGQATVVNR